MLKKRVEIKLRKFSVYNKLRNENVSVYLQNKDEQLDRSSVILKKKEGCEYFHPLEFFNLDYFYNKISLLCRLNVRYSFIVRLGYLDSKKGGNTNWKTLGDQIGL